jgi:hypothetical protein
MIGLCRLSLVSLDRVEKPRLLFALCSRFIRLGGFFMEFRGRNAHPNRPQKAMVCPTVLCKKAWIANYSMFTARAARIAMVTSETAACSIIRILAQRESTGTSVGENAVLVLNARNR